MPAPPPPRRVKPRSVEDDIDDLLADCYADPLRYVMAMFPWSFDSSIQTVKLPPAYRARFPNAEYGPDQWACEYLDQLGADIKARAFDGRTAVSPIKYTVSSGHGIGKSVMVAWLVKFIMDTRPYCKGTVTANTVPQLRTKTWAAVGDWHKMSLTRDRFDYRAGQQLALRHKEFPEKWFCTAQTCKEENSESFAGQHAANSTSFYIFDEASAVPSKIYEVREGGLTDGEPMVFDFGNPTRNSGEFYQNCTNAGERSYRFWKIDSRTVQVSNKILIDEWIRTRGGIDSPFCRVRICGEFPATGDIQFISTADVDAAALRPLAPDRHAPLVLGVDVAGDGGDDSVIFPRMGNDARTFPPWRYNGLDTVQLVGKVIEAVHYFKGLGLTVAGIFVDAGGLGKGVYDQLRHLNYRVTNVQFGGGATDPQAYRRKGDEMWGAMRDAFKTGLCISHERTPLMDDLRTQLTSREFDDTNGPIHLETKPEMKKRGIGSPDIADALALTYAQEVAYAMDQGFAAPMFCNFEYDPMEKW